MEAVLYFLILFSELSRKRNSDYVYVYQLDQNFVT